jgi:hypothetical protein
MAQNYFKDAFGEFAPRSDKDAAVKFCLNLLIADERWNDLIDLLSADSEIAGIEGDPGWILERRDQGANQAGYSKWPEYARYRVFVDPEGYCFASPQAYYDGPTFHRYVRLIVHAYAKSNSVRTESALRVLQLTDS